jgi:hypothetical protein
MLILLHARYPATSLKAGIDAFMSPKTPPRSGASKEIASFVYGDSEGYHSLFILDVDDAKFGDFMKAQVERNVYMES